MLKLLSQKRSPSGIVKTEDVFNHFFSNFLDDFFTPIENCDCQCNSFKVDILEDMNCYILEADLPGFNKKNLTISYESNYLTIAAQKEEVEEERKAHFVRRERQVGIFSRSFYIENIDESSIEAEFTDGLLKVRIPKLKALNTL